MKLLLVEDDPADSRLFQEMLNESPQEAFQFQQVSRLKSALERLREEVFDVVLLDLGLPDSQGMATLNRAEQGHRVPIVVLTGLADESFAVEAVRAGAQDYLVKGQFNRELLVRTIRYAIERKRSEEEIRQLNADLEGRVAERTAELERANRDLLKQIQERQRVELALQQAQVKLAAHADELEKIVNSRTAKLHETIAEIEQFSYAIVHDLRAPLRAMQGFAELIEEECAQCGRPLSREYFRRIRIASCRMDQLIADSLSYSKIARLELVLEPVNLFQLVDGLVQTYPNLQRDQADIRVDSQLPTVLGNTAALTQCFSNLLGNAVKFCKAGSIPQVRVWSGPGDLGASSPLAPSKARIWVEDNGIGIPKEAQSRIFGMFQRANTDREGTGIGLAIVRKVVERMGGQVGVVSEPGQGSRFWVELPLATPLPNAS